jgi:acetyl-CoA carboxylase biotin carboxyl carrier protein
MSETPKGAGEPFEAGEGQLAAEIERDAAPGAPSPETASASPETLSLLSLVDRLGALLEKSDLAEIEVEAGETGIVLRKPAALAPSAGDAATPVAEPPAPVAHVGDAPAEAPAPYVKSVRAPLTGVFYASPSPTSPPYVTVGQRIEVGQVIGLIEAMKLFNEIKSDQAGRVTRIVAESGKLVKAKQPLIEVEPA